MERLKRMFVATTLVAMAMQFFVLRVSTTLAFTAGDVVINEIAWMGSVDGTSDEWIELYNASGQEIDLSGWSIEDDLTTVYTIDSGIIGPKGYFLIEDSEVTTDIAADVVIPISLANAGDSLVLKDADGFVIDTVNGSGGAWYSGDSASKATMERVDPGVSVDSTDNWATAVSSNGAKGRNGTEILGTPGSANSVYGGSGPEVSVMPGEMTAAQGETVTFSVDVSGVVDLYSYGFEINYDPAVINFVSASEGGFLNADSVTTSFNAALENGNEGKIIVGNARLMNPPVGIDGSGTLFDLTFSVDTAASGSSGISFGAGSFLSDSVGDLLAQFNGGNVTVGSSEGLSVTGFTVAQGANQYSLELSWSGIGATTYLVTREEVDGSFVQLAEVTGNSYVDDLSLIPGITYNYQVIAMNGSLQSVPAEGSGSDDRGLTGDNDRSGRVDGRDLEQLARAYGSGFGDEEYDALVDTNYDGLIDGSDLIDIGVNFGLTY